VRSRDDWKIWVWIYGLSLQRATGLFVNSLQPGRDGGAILCVFARLPFPKKRDWLNFCRVHLYLRLPNIIWSVYAIMSARGVRLFGLNYVSTRAALAEDILFELARIADTAQERPKSISKNSASSKDVTISTLCVRMLKLCSLVSNNLFLFVRNGGILNKFIIISAL